MTEKDNFTWDNPIMYDKTNGRCRCIPIPYKLQKKERLKMTDKFKLVKSEPHIENIETGECYDLDSDNFSYIVKVMNDLSNENKKLKQENERLSLQIIKKNRNKK